GVGMVMGGVGVVGWAGGFRVMWLRSPPNAHAHAGGGYVLHNESEWAVVLRLEPPSSRSRYVRLRARESLVLPRMPSEVAVMFSGAGPFDGSKDDPLISLDLSRFGGTSDDYGSLEVITSRCLAVRMRLGRGAEPPGERPVAV